MSAVKAKKTNSRRNCLFVIGVFGLIYLGLGIIHLFYGRMTGDEGWQCLASRNVFEGLLPYRDFHYSQMPLVPIVYASWFKLFGPSLASGRSLSLLFGVIGLVCAQLAAYRRGGFWAAVICGILLALNLHYVFDTVTFKTQPLTVALAAVAILVLSKTNPSSRIRQMTLAMAFMSLAFLSRLSLLPAIMLLWIYAIWSCRKQWPLMAGLIGFNILIFGAVFFGFWSDGNMLFGIYLTHKEYFGNPAWSLERFVFGFLKGWASNEFLLMFCFIWAAFFLFQRIVRQGFPAIFKEDTILFDLYLLGAYAGVTLIHMVNVQNHPTHQTSIIVLAAVFGACGLARFFQECDRPTRHFAMGSLLLLAGLSAPFQEWNIHFDGAGSLGRISAVCQAISKYAKPGDTLLTFNAEVTVNSGLMTMPGYDMSEFTYFPMMDDARASKLKVTNLNKLLDDISSGHSRIFCVGDREFSMMCAGNDQIAERIKRLVAEKYQQVAKIDQYGQFFGTMYVFVRKD